MLFAVAAAGCASPIEGLWPPAPGEPTHRIVVFSDHWHTSIGVFGPDDPEGIDRSGYREWGYAQKAWYHDGEGGGCSAVCGAIFCPSEAVVVVRSDGQDMTTLTEQGPVLGWEFRLTRAGYRALVEHLEAEKAEATPFSDLRGFDWYRAAHSYHGFHHCHHFTIRALRAAGLPVWRVYALLRPWTRAQLDRAARIQEESRAETP